MGSLVLASRSSLKKAWAHACSGLMREEGVYSSRRATSSMASGGVRARNTCWHHTLIYTTTLQPNTGGAHSRDTVKRTHDQRIRHTYVSTWHGSQIKLVLTLYCLYYTTSILSLETKFSSNSKFLYEYWITCTAYSKFSSLYQSQYLN